MPAMKPLSRKRVQQLLDTARQRRALVVGDAMVDQFIWGRVERISPEAPVPVVQVERESYMPGGAANVARNLTSLGVGAEMLGVIGKDAGARQLKELLAGDNVASRGLIESAARSTTKKIRVIAHTQQVARVDRETPHPIAPEIEKRLLAAIKRRLPDNDALIVGDYCKGVVTQSLLDRLKELCRARGVWLSMDPKPFHPLDLGGLSLITPNRKEAFSLAGVEDETRGKAEPFADKPLMRAAEKLLTEIRPAVLLITLGDHGMLLCQRDKKPYHIPTMAQETFDVSGAGDTVIATFTTAIMAEASPVEAAILSNHAAGIVVGKVGTATVTPEELLASFGRNR